MLQLEDNDLFRGGILAEEMGLGKTATGFALICYRKGRKAKTDQDNSRKGDDSKARADQGNSGKERKRKNQSTTQNPAGKSLPILRPNDDWNINAIRDNF